MPGEPNEPKTKVSEEELSARLGREITDYERDLLGVINAGLAREPSTWSLSVTSPPPARRLLAALRAAIEIAEQLVRQDGADQRRIREVLAELAPHLQGIALAADELIDLGAVATSSRAAADSGSPDAGAAAENSGEQRETEPSDETGNRGSGA